LYKVKENNSLKCDELWKRFPLWDGWFEGFVESDYGHNSHRGAEKGDDSKLGKNFNNFVHVYSG
jgi:hypothetical protein